VFFEPGALTAQERKALAAKGHTLEEARQPWGNMQALEWNRATGKVRAASDPRGEGKAWVGAIKR